MDRMIYTALSGMRGSLRSQDALANNMANAGTIGFRADRAAFEPQTVKGPSHEVRSTSVMMVRDADMRPGAVNETGRDMDVAVAGRAMMAVQDPEGNEAYTRRGDLVIGASQLLTTGDGHPVLGEGGPITIPAAESVSIAADGSVVIVPQGGEPGVTEIVGRIKLASTEGSKLHKSLDTLFRVEGGGVLPVDPEAQLIPGALEQSNVRPAEMLVTMIEGQRLFDIRTNLIATARDLDQSSAGLLRLRG